MRRRLYRKRKVKEYHIIAAVVNALAACTVLSCTNELTNLLGYTHVIGPRREATCLGIFYQVGLKPACLSDNGNCVCGRFGFHSAHAYCVGFVMPWFILICILAFIL